MMAVFRGRDPQWRAQMRMWGSAAPVARPPAAGHVLDAADSDEGPRMTTKPHLSKEVCETVRLLKDDLTIVLNDLDLHKGAHSPLSIHTLQGMLWKLEGLHRKAVQEALSQGLDWETAPRSSSGSSK